ncbi:MAG: PilZ domain-containing protein [Candidatus Electrothrix sp. AR3]|nr:PilZ domain-containing protein [Candidatus Electrothrix sp. AR3]
MMHSTPRRFTRVNFKQPIQLDFENKQYKEQFVSNISLAGVYVNGHFEQQVGDTCTLELRQGGPNAQLDLRAKGSVVRVNGEGIAIEFISMNHSSLLFLQTVLLYEAEDPMLFGSEFIQNISFELEEEE